MLGKQSDQDVIEECLEQLGDEVERLCNEEQVERMNLALSYHPFYTTDGMDVHKQASYGRWSLIRELSCMCMCLNVLKFMGVYECINMCACIRVFRYVYVHVLVYVCMCVSSLHVLSAFSLYRMCVENVQYPFSYEIEPAIPSLQLKLTQRLLRAQKVAESLANWERQSDCTQSTNICQDED